LLTQSHEIAHPKSLCSVFKPSMRRRHIHFSLNNTFFFLFQPSQKIPATSSFAAAAAAGATTTTTTIPLATQKTN
jgi:hypothetical protein